MNTIEQTPARKHCNKSVLLLPVLFCTSFLQVGFLRAQQLATLSVTVTDPAGSVVPGAQVTLSDARTGLIRTQAADGSGSTVLTALTAGDYQLSVKADAFSQLDQPVTLTVGQVASIAVRLGMAVVKQSIAVSESSASAVETDKTETSQVIRPNQIADLPIAGRDFIDFVLLTPTANVGRSTATAKLTERFSTEASIEAFNLFNHFNVQNIDQVYGAADFLGPVPRQYGDNIGSSANPNFATPNYASPARQLQASLRITF